jgi:hypothetical protein
MATSSQGETDPGLVSAMSGSTRMVGKSSRADAADRAAVPRGPVGRPARRRWSGSDGVGALAGPLRSSGTAVHGNWHYVPQAEHWNGASWSQVATTGFGYYLPVAVPDTHGGWWSTGYPPPGGGATKFDDLPAAWQ